MKKNENIQVIEEEITDKTMLMILKKVENNEIIFRGNFLFRYKTTHGWKAKKMLAKEPNLSRIEFLARIAKEVHPQFTPEEVLKFLEKMLEVYHTHTEKIAETATV